LGKTFEKRTKKDLLKMEQFFLQFPFLKKLAQENDHEILTSCCKHMKLSTH
jgi:hypothetical protein